MNTQLILGEHNLTLHRYPIKKNEQHQAWDSADELLLDELNKINLPVTAHILIFNDNFGALSCYASQKGFQVTCINDSFVSQQSIEQNNKNNFTTQSKVINYLSSIDPIPQDFDLVIMKLPKNNRLLIWQLTQLAQTKQQNVKLIAGAKVKDIHTSTLSLFEKHLGITKTSLAKKKSRLIFCEKNKQLDMLPDPMTQFFVDHYNIKLANYPNVFSAEKLDVAAYLMLEHIPTSEKFEHIIDLGCGNGVLAIQAAKQNPQAQITAVDESHMAVASAKINLLNNGIEEERIACQVNDSLTGFKASSADLILCNPPFHQQQTVTDHIAWQMFCDAKQILKPKGKLLVIGNRHLGYHIKLQRIFSKTTVIASNKKFSIIQACR